jgi:putative Holliday junction resolvase
MRYLGLDMGERRVGVAVSDPDGVVATPVSTLDAGADLADRVAAMVTEYSVGAVVVGLPVRTDGKEGPEAAAARETAAALGARLHVPVHLNDERFTTRVAAGAARAAGMRKRRQRSRVDALAATVMLQSFLDMQKAG